MDTMGVIFMEIIHVAAIKHFRTFELPYRDIIIHCSITLKYYLSGAWTKKN